MLRVQTAISLMILCSCVGQDGVVTPESIATLQRSIDKSGTRIERWSHITAGILTDGTQIDTPPRYTLFDTKYNWECTMRLASDGQTRCLRGNAALDGTIGEQFADPSCVDHIVIGPFIDTKGTYGQDYKADVYPLGSEIIPAPSIYYELSSGLCAKRMIGTYPWPVRARRVGAKIPASDFIGYASIGPVDTKL